MFTRAVLPFAVVLLIAADEPAKDVKKELDKLQGEWTMVSMETRGRKFPDEEVGRYKLTIKDDQWIVTSGSQETKQAIKIDPSKDPKTLDLTFKVGDQERLSRGIYKLEGDTLTLCRTQGERERPKEFKTTNETAIVVVWKRAKK
jgi:uncharacterized protein (TIGR03067 family)